MDRIKVLFILVSAVILIGSFWYLYDFASRSDLRDYIGDEVWYVPASRNVLHRLDVTLHYVNETTNAAGINVIFSNTSVRVKYQYDVERIALRYNATHEMEYLKFPGVYFEIPVDNVEGFLNALSGEIPADAYYVVPGYRYPDKENIQNYLNTEHPFLGKDLIMLGMLAEDKPINWRLPGIVAFVLIGILVVIATYRVSGSYLAAFIALLFAVADPTLEATAVTAMLDIHVALFVALFTALMIYEKREAAGFAVGLAAAAKLSGAFAYPILLTQALRKEQKFGRFLLSTVILPGIGFLISNVPGIMVVGFRTWLNDFLSSFRWHLSNKGGHPAASPVWEWFVNHKAFPFHYRPDIYAQTDPFLLLSMVLFILALPWLHRRRGKLVVPFGIFWITVGFFVLQYALGGTTQFSFYATVLVPPAAIVMGAALRELLRWEAFTESLWLYLEWLFEIKDRIRLRLGR
ncbi:dolichyl-phosphate-mannose--protein mannosyltransferase [Thermococcus sp. 21S7]|uniref:dolichyl-phosphate-mannose--protein mannosyltransferase n=1 Tax=Thermococcus sp. 21S7 TaxID=1638221 RepID=UPI001438B5A4|nr:dolichyl-phosphate-mannose--protein mannosyltransferase [Thermococcus sp. 21S7]NJE61383.1 dolichyl-phosphate-mannose--protein mannosyltransferase [Thermococcus sp. 21S7]